MKPGMKINWIRFLLLAVFIFGLTFFSLLCAWGRDEGTLGYGWFRNFVADAFTVFRFPTHTLFWDYINGSNFILGLTLNALIYALIIEFLLTLLIRKRSLS